MMSKGFPKKFSLSLWVEGPLEGLMDLSAEVDGYKSRNQRNLAMATIVMLTFMVLLSITLILEAWNLAAPLVNSTIPPDVWGSATRIIIVTIFLAITFISTLLLFQIWRYAGVMQRRFENVEDLLAVPVPEREAEEKSPGHAGPKIFSEPYHGLFNLLGASNAFTRDIVKNMPQVCRQLGHIRNMLFIMPLYFLTIRFIYPVFMGLTANPVFSSIDYIMIDSVYISLSLIAVLGGLHLLEAGRYLEWLHARLDFLDSVRNAPRPLIPEKEKPGDRLAAHLRDFDSCYKSIEGQHVDEYIIKHEDKNCVVLALHTSTVPEIETVKRFRNEVQSILDIIGSYLPHRGRFIILYTGGDGSEEIDDEVADYIMSNPLLLGRGPGGGRAETVIQIMIEEEGAYGMFPFVE